MILAYMHDYGEYRGVQDVLSRDDIVSIPLSKHIEREIPQQSYRWPAEDDIVLTGLVSDSQDSLIDYCNENNVYCIGYYDFPFYRKTLRHNSQIRKVNELWVPTYKCKKALEGLGVKNVYVVGNNGYDTTKIDRKSEDYLLWVGQHGPLYEESFNSFKEVIDVPFEVATHPSVAKCDLFGMMSKAKAVIGWDTTTFMIAYVNKIPTIAYEVDKDDHDNVFMNNSICYPAFPETVKSVVNMAMEGRLGPLYKDGIYPTNSVELMNERLDRWQK